MSRRLDRIGPRSRSGRSAPSPMISIAWRTGSRSAGSRRSPWSRPGSTGFRCSRSWSNAVSRFCWSTPATPSMCRAASQRCPVVAAPARVRSAARQFSSQGRDRGVARAYLRQRERLVELSASHIQHMQKALMQMNVQVHHVVSDIMGVTGLRILRAIVAGERDPGVLAANRDRRCRADVETIQRALTGTWRAEHLFALEQALALYDTCQEKVVACDRKIEATLKRIEAQSAKPVVGDCPPARRTTRQPNAVDFDVRTALHAVLGVDLTQIHGLGPYLALKLVGECGTDLSAWPSAKHFPSWLGLAPSNKISGGKVLSSRTRRSSNR